MTFSFPVRVYYEDTDAGGVIYYANYLRFAERARTEWLRQAGFDQRDLWQSHGIGFVVRRAEVDYHAPAFLDDVLSVQVIAKELKRSSLKMQQNIMRGNEIVAAVVVTLVCVTQDIRPARIPEEIIQRLHF